MKSINLIVLGIAVLASLAFVLTIEQQYAAGFNDRHQSVSNSGSHQRCGTTGCEGNSAGVFITEDVNNSYNCNTNRDVECKTNNVNKP